jgi:23S rRNA pseudouridine1911/1915/1917 synthase
MRLDIHVHELLPGLSRASVQKLVERGRVKVNDRPVVKAGYRLRETDKVTVDYKDNEQQIPSIEVPVIYEDEHCVVINKPVGVLTHSKGAFNPEATVASWLHEKVPAMEGDRAGIVHRLDRATSGVMILAKTPEALGWLQKQFSQRKTKKTYIAVAEGLFKEPEAIIDMPIERNPKKPQTFRVGSNGKSAQTAYKLINHDGKRSLVQLNPVTGRTHQLRVHLYHIGHPIVGDTLYGGQPAERLFLHARSLEITLPSRERKVFEAGVPAEFKEPFS